MAYRKTSTCPPCAAPIHVSWYQSQPFDRAHMSTSRCPPVAAKSHVMSPRGPVVVGPRQCAELPSIGGILTGTFVPRTTVFTSPPQHRQIPHPSRYATNTLVPGAPVLPRPLQDIYMIGFGSIVAYVSIPRTIIFFHVTKNLQVTTGSSHCESA